MKKQPNIYGDVLTPPAIDFDAVRDGRRSPIAFFDLDLSTARSIATGTATIVEVAGDSFFCDLDPVNQGVAVVHLQDTALSYKTAPIYLTPGSIIKAPFTRLLIENAAQAGMRLRIFYGVGIDFTAGAGSNVTVSGYVSVIDGGKSRTLAGIAYSGGGTVAPGAGNYASAQLMNPAGSGKRAVVSQVTMQASNADGVGLYVRNDGFQMTNAVVNAGFPSKLSGGGVSACKLQTGFNAVFGTLSGGLQPTQGFNLPASGSFTYKLTEPIVIRAGASLIAVLSTASNSGGASFEFYEEADV